MLAVQSPVFDALERLAGRRAGTVAFCWALAEATVWPILPDFALGPLAAVRPSSWPSQVIGASLGTLIGGALTYCVGWRAPGLVERQPLVTPRMRALVAGWFAAEGARGVLHQPLAGVPYKAFAREAGRRALPLGPFLAWTLVGRGARFVGVGAIGALVGTRARPLLRRHCVLLALSYTALFALALAAVVRKR